MASLVQVPYAPGVWCTPDTLTRLADACRRAGHNIPLSEGWRSYAQQAYYYDQYLHHGGPPASNPDTGQRNHMRGAAFDIQNKADRAAMLAAGFTPDADEWWHFNNPNWPNMPIIPVNLWIGSSTAGGGGVPINNVKRSKNMYLQWTTDGTGWLVLEPGWQGLPSMQIYNLFYRVIKSDQSSSHPDTFLRAEVDMMAAVQRAIYQGVVGGPISVPTLDTTKLADAVVTSLNAKGITASLKADDPALAKALDAGFVRSMAAYANAASTATAGSIGFDATKLANAVAQSLQKTGVVTTVDTQAVQDAVSAAIARATAAIAKATATANAAAGING